MSAKTSDASDRPYPLAGVDLEEEHRARLRGARLTRSLAACPARRWGSTRTRTLEEAIAATDPSPSMPACTKASAPSSSTRLTIAGIPSPGPASCSASGRSPTVNRRPRLGRQPTHSLKQCRPDADPTLGHHPVDQVHGRGTDEPSHERVHGVVGCQFTGVSHCCSTPVPSSRQPGLHIVIASVT